MAELITSTTAETLIDAVIRRIAGMQPTAVRHRAHRWTPEYRNRRRATSLQVRAFIVTIVPGGELDGGLTGLADVETEADLLVRVDYRSVPIEDLDLIVTHDAQDLADRLCDSWHPTIAGLTRSEVAGLEFVDDEQVQRVEYSFAISYLRARTTT